MWWEISLDRIRPWEDDNGDGWPHTTMPLWQFCFCCWFRHHSDCPDSFYLESLRLKIRNSIHCITPHNPLLHHIDLHIFTMNWCNNWRIPSVRRNKVVQTTPSCRLVLVAPTCQRSMGSMLIRVHQNHPKSTRHSQKKFLPNNLNTNRTH